METISSNDGLLSIVEVIEHVKSQRGKRNSLSSKDCFNLREAVENQILDYVNYLPYQNTNCEHTLACLQSIKNLNYNLTEAEMLQLVDHMPTSPVEVYLVTLIS